MKPDHPVNKAKSRSQFIRDLREEVGDDFVTIRVKFDDKLFNVNLMEQLLDFDPNDYESMQKAFAEQAPQSAKYGIVLSNAKKRLSEIELEEKKWRRSVRSKVTSKIYKKWKEEYKIRKSPTKDDIDAEIDAMYPDDSDLFAKKIFKWRNIVDQLEVAYRAWRDRKDMLISEGHITNRLIDNDAIVLKNRLERK